MPKSRIVFCPNQIAITIALALHVRDGSAVRTVAVYWPDRCGVKDLQAAGVRCLPYSRMICVWLLLRYGLLGSLECCIPHRRLGRLIDAFSSLSAFTSLVDDGLDTLRDQPRNIDPDAFGAGTRFYTFRYQGPLGRWLGRFEVQRVADLSSLARTGRPTLDLAGVQRLVVESPPLGECADALDLARGDTLVVAHSNVNKRTLAADNARMVSGSEVALERSLDTFDGEIVVGESMVAVYALSLPVPCFNLSVHLPAAHLSNLGPLRAMIAARSYATLHVC